MALSPDMTAHAGSGGVKKTPARGRSGTRWRELDRYPSNVLAIFHITHVDNLPTIISNGLGCDATASTAGVTRVDIGYSQIKERRARREVSRGPGGTLNDYVPFYFGARSPMLYTISQGNVPQYRDGQESIVHLQLDAEEIAVAGLPYVFTDGHAVIEISTFNDDLAEVADHVDLELMHRRYWYDTLQDPDRMRRRQAEFLVHGSVPWTLVERIGVMTDACKVQVAAIVATAGHQPPIDVRPDWYY
jgi:hypothetical protein